METKKIFEIINNIENKSNKDLMVVQTELEEEFNKTKDLIINLTRHLENVEEIYKKLDKELSKRIKK